MSTTEDRLIAALAARADQVHAEDLRAPEVPEVPATVTFLRRPAAYAVGIAAAAAAIAAPFVIGGLGSDDSPMPPATEGPSPTLAPQTDIGGDWPVTYRQGFDLDGDGTPERVRLRSEPGEPLIGPRIRIESDLSGGGSVFGVTDSGGVGVNFMDPVDLDGDGSQELMLNSRPGDGLSSDWIVVDLVDGQLVELEQDRVGPLVLGRRARPRRPRPGLCDGPVDLPRRVLALLVAVAAKLRQVRHELRGARPLRRAGVVVGDRRPPAGARGSGPALHQPGGGNREPCTGDEGEDVPTFFPAETNLIGVGESFTTDVDFDQVDDTVSLEGQLRRRRPGRRR